MIFHAIFWGDGEIRKSSGGLRNEWKLKFELKGYSIYFWR